MRRITHTQVDPTSHCLLERLSDPAGATQLVSGYTRGHLAISPAQRGELALARLLRNPGKVKTGPRAGILQEQVQILRLISCPLSSPRLLSSCSSS